MDNNKIAIYGAYGYVGQAITRLLENQYDLTLIDPTAPEQPTQEQIDACPHAIICVPTPRADDGSCDTRIVEEVLKGSNHQSYLIKSTIPPKTTDRLIAETGKEICFSPEYIGEGKYVTRWWDLNHPHPVDMTKHTFQIFGGKREATRKWVNIFSKVLGPSAIYSQTDSETAEFVKYMENCWGAMKVTWANEMYEICQALGLDYYEVRELWALDGRVEKMHTMIWPNKRGFGGKCFPKDVSAIVKFAEKAGYDAKLVKQVLASNDHFTGADKPVEMTTPDEVKPA